MNNKQQLANFLGLARRAGMMTSGEDLVVKAIQNRSAKLVFLANDASPNLTKKINDKTSYYEIAYSTIFSEHELSSAIGQDRKVIAIMDDGFAKKMEQIMNN